MRARTVLTGDVNPMNVSETVFCPFDDETGPLTDLAAASAAPGARLTRRGEAVAVEAAG